MISREEKQQILYTFNETASKSSYPPYKSLHQWFAGQAARTPDKTAVVFNHQQVTYRELDQRSNRLSRYLYRLKGDRDNVMIGICMDPGIYVTAAIWAILKSGGAYVPIEPNLPGERKKQMIRDTNIGIVLSEKQYEKDLDHLHLAKFPYDDLNMLSLPGLNCEPLQLDIRADDLCCVIFTSGVLALPGSGRGT